MTFPAVALRSSVSDTSSLTASSLAARNNWSIKRFIRATSVLIFSSSPLPGNISSAPVMMVSGVRSSWAALAVNRRCWSKPSSRRSKALLIAITRGRISSGRFFSSRRSDMVSGSIAAACPAISRTGLSPLRMAKIPTSKVTMIKTGITQATSSTNSSIMACRSASSSPALATVTARGPVADSSRMLSP